MFWVDAGVQKRIERAHMDGSNRLVVVSTNVSMPTGLAIDHISSKIYWVDSATKTINLAKFDGTGRRILLCNTPRQSPSSSIYQGNNDFSRSYPTVPLRTGCVRQLRVLERLADEIHSESSQTVWREPNHGGVVRARFDGSENLP